MRSRSVEKVFYFVACLAAAGPGTAADLERVRERGSAETAAVMDAQSRWDFGGPLPGAPPFDAELVERLSAAWERRAPTYLPRTRHLRAPGSPRYTNRLFLQSSPYLRQHAHNPVNWYPWGEEAFAAARALGRPVLLSVGYSTCHWCHVMEEESFEDEEIARFLNENYIAIKVDREERPDIDAVYMSAVQMLTGAGGWPMNVWLTPDRKPFYAGTYFPAHDGDRGVELGFLSLLKALRDAYDQQPERIAESSTLITRAIRRDLAPATPGAGLPDAAVLRAAARYYADRIDGLQGGLEGAPKFPSDVPVRFLLRYHRRAGDAQALQMATLTLEKMAAGGLYDQVGGGFHRYSTDAGWQVPHFEKMLYDNALLVIAYLEAYQVTGREDFAQVARDTLRYAERDMSSPQGGFYSATDADSLAPDGRREEGRFFTWTEEEIEEVLGEELARVVNSYYDVTLEGNFEGRNILHVPSPVEKVAQELKRPAEQVRAILGQGRERLYAARAKRPAPLRDEKILTAWNGLMISAFARAALALEEEGYALRAARAADFVLTKMRKDGRLLRSFTGTTAAHEAYLEDYAFFIAGLLDLFEASGEPRWLTEAIALDAVLARHYEDAQGGGYYRTGEHGETLLAREKPAYDGAEPSGNSVQALNLLRLHGLTSDDRYRRRAEHTLRAFAGRLAQNPAALSEMLLAVDFELDTAKEVVIVSPAGRSNAAPLLSPLAKTFVPNRVLAVVEQGTPLETLAATVPLLEGKVARGGEATAYVCEHRVCELPTSDPETFARQLAKHTPLEAERPAAASP